MAPKAAAKNALQADFGLERRPGALVFGVVSRLTEQKGLHLLIHVLAELVQRVALRLLPGQDLEPEFIGTLRPRNARLMMGVTDR